MPAGQITTILSSGWPAPNDPLDTEPTTTRLERAFDGHYHRGDADGGKAGRRLYLYLAGHGFAPELDDAALLMANAARGIAGYHVAGRQYANWFRQAGFFDEVVLFMDCCRERYRSVKRPPAYGEISAARPADYCYGLATEWSRAAREQPWGPQGEIRGLFTIALLEGLSGRAPRDEAGRITAVTLERFVINYMSERQTGLEEPQEPRFDYSKNERVIAFSAPKVPLTRVRVVTQPGVDGGSIEILDGNLEKVTTPPVATGPAGVEWELRPGLYLARAPARAPQQFQVMGEPVHVQL